MAMASVSVAFLRVSSHKSKYVAVQTAADDPRPSFWLPAKKAELSVWMLRGLAH
jgi:hypothetical protein